MNQPRIVTSRRTSLAAMRQSASTFIRLTLATVVLTTTLAGCRSNKATVCDLKYCDDITGLKHVRNFESHIAYPCIDTKTPEAVASSQPPRTIMNRIEDTPREMSLDEAIRTALSLNEVIETSALGGVGSKAVLNNPDAVSSVFDPGIQRSSVLFGRGRGVEAALADFDATFSTSMMWGKDLAFGTVGPGSREVGAFTSRLQKQFAHGGTLALNHNWNYSESQGSRLAYPSAYVGNIGAEYRHPLLAGSGTEFTRISGPTNPFFGAITGVGQGVLIARISSDISIADFELAVRNAVQDVENAYWDLYLAYRTYDTSVVAHQSAFQTWRESQDRLEVGIMKPADELQARDRLYETKAGVESSLSSLFKAESELRRLIGLSMNDGTVIRPSDEPHLAEFIPDWDTSLRQGLTKRIELRRQKWSIKSNQLQLHAAKSLVRPRLDFVGGYDVNGVGDNLLSQSGSRLSNVYGSFNSDELSSWSAGVELSVPIGYRQARSQVRNIELQLTKSMAVLASQEKNIAHDIATAMQDVTASYAAAQSNHRRLAAASRRVELLEAERDVGTLTLDLVLRAQASMAAAQGDYYRQVVEYTKALTTLQLATGNLLENHNVQLAEGPWYREAYDDAKLRAHARTHAKDAPHLDSVPGEFVSYGPTGTVELSPPIQSREVNLPPIEESPLESSVPEAAPAPVDETAPEPEERLQSSMERPDGVPSIPVGQSMDAKTSLLNLSLQPLENGAPYVRRPTRSASSATDFPRPDVQ